MKIVVAGGSGFLGSALVARARADGHDVLVLTRRPRAAGEMAWSPGDDRPGQPWMQAIDGADAAINLAGESIGGGRWTAARKRAIRESRVVATRAMAGAIVAARRPPAVFISSSAVGIYGSRGDDPITEDAPTGPGFLGEVGRAWEQEARRASPVTRVVLLRSGVVLGRGGGALPQLARPFWFYAGGRMGSGRQYLSWIHRDDWVAMICWVLTTEAVAGVINATAPEPVTNATFARTLGDVIRRPAWLPVPALPLRWLLGEMADGLILEGQRVIPARAQALGFAFRYPTLERALRAIY